MILPCGCRAYSVSDTKSIICVHRVWRVSDLPVDVTSQALHTISQDRTRQVQNSLWRELHVYGIVNVVVWDVAVAKAWFADWLTRVPIYGCNCKANFESYCNSNPPDFSSGEMFFRWSVAAHNYVSVNHAVPRKESITLEQAYSIYQPKPGEYYRPVPSDLLLIPTNPKDYLVVTVATGEHHERMMLDMTGPKMYEYAQRIGADFLALTGTTQAWWGLEKFRVGPLVAQYKRTLFVDADVLIRSDAPNIFDEVPIGHIAMHDDWNAQGCHHWHRKQRDLLWESQGVPPLHPETMRNSGVIVVDQIHADIWTPPLRPVPENHCDEQFWIERWSRFYDFYKLPNEWNTQWYYPDFPITRSKAHFLHFACCPNNERIRQLKRELENGNTKNTITTIKAKSWEHFKQSDLVTPYPPKPFAIPQDLSGWSTATCYDALVKLGSELKDQQVIIELGSFLGAISTQAFLKNPNINLICVDNFNHNPKWIAEDSWPNGATPYFQGIGTVWEHFVNNTWEDKERIAPLTIDAGPITLKLLFEAGLDPSLFLIDADHSENAVYNQLQTIIKLWPKATIVLDDYTDDWPGVKVAFQRIKEEKLFNSSDTFTLIDNRLMIIRRGKHE